MSVAVSVVVPVYNAEKYLSQCVDSLLAQSFHDVEFIFVDDGSTDRSAEILEAYKAKDKRITVIHQQNQYGGVARNNGMKVAVGKYIIFLDADDFFAPNMLEEAYCCAESKQAQIVVFAYQFYDNVTGKQSPCRKQCFPEEVFTVNQFSPTFFLEYNAAPWNKLYLKQFIDEKGIQFQPVRKSDDAFFVMMTACLADRIAFLDKSFVFYRINNPTSIEGDPKLDRSSFLPVHASIKAELQKRGLFVDQVRLAFSQYEISSIKHYYQIGIRNPASLRDYFNAVKSIMIPGLFDSESDFSEDFFVSTLYKSEDFDGFLLTLLDAAEKRASELRKTVTTFYETTVPKSSKAYKLGNCLLSIPRAILKLFSGKK